MDNDARDKIAMAQSHIATALKTFTRDTGLLVHDVDFENMVIRSGDGQVISISYKIVLNVTASEKPE